MLNKFQQELVILYNYMILMSIGYQKYSRISFAGITQCPATSASAKQLTVSPAFWSRATALPHPGSGHLGITEGVRGASGVKA